MSEATLDRETPMREAAYATDVNRRGFLQRKTWSEGSYSPRFDAIKRYVEQRSVLDLGCSSGHWRSDWVHGQMAEVASELVGLDINMEAVIDLTDRGLDVRFGNAESFELDRTFDVIMAGELVEHLENFGGMLRSARRHLKPEGRLVLTTPNAFSVANFVYRLKGRPRVNGDHTCWFCEDTLSQLLERTGFEVVEVKYLHYQAPGLVRGALARAIRRVLPERLAWSTLIIVARPVAASSE